MRENRGMKAFTICFLLILFVACKKESSDFLLSADTNIVDSTSTQTFNQEFHRLVNEHRMGLGLHPLIMNEEVNIIAREHSANMASGNVSFGHSGFSSRCSMARKVLGGGNLCAENVAMGQKNPEALFDAWMDSPTHRGNIEQERITHTGFGYFRSGNGPYYWTQIYLEL